MPPGLILPQLGLTMTEAVLSEWKVGEGEAFAKGTVLVVVETDKIATEIEAEHDGTLGRIRVAQGETAQVGATLADFVAPGGSDSAEAAASSLTPREPASVVPQAVTASIAEGAPRVVATPLARRVARDSGVDLAQVVGTGPGGRIKAWDVQAAAAQDAPPAPVRDQQAMSSPTTPRPAAALPDGELRQPTAREMTAARRLTESKATIPHFYLTSEAEVSALERMRAELRERLGGLRVTMTHLALRAVAAAIDAEPRFNTIWTDAGLHTVRSVDIGIAVATEHGLMAPVVRSVQGNALGVLIDKVDAVVARARGDRLLPTDIGGGCLTISNAGMLDVTYMASIINPGQSAILGMGSVRGIFRPGPDGAPVARRELGLVLSCDHRVYDGSLGLMLLNRIRGLLENPLALLAA